MDSDISSKTSDFGIGEAGSIPESSPLDELEAIQLTKSTAPVKMVRCDCGHTVPSIHVMSASLGRVCPDCYDDWSD